jgi:hypothetical protein
MAVNIVPAKLMACGLTQAPGSFVMVEVKMRPAKVKKNETMIAGHLK